MGDGGVHFRVWAPGKAVDVIIGEDTTRHAAVRLRPEENGYHSALVTDAGAGTLYRYRVDGADTLLPDPASRFQPDGPHGPSEVIDPASFRWSDQAWPGVGGRRHVIYEMHVGTFTPEGSWCAATEQIAELARLGVTLIEVMPVAEFPGRFGWGYDGVDLWAPTRLYGSPDDFRRFVDRAHEEGVGVILDVVYNHLGPSGNYLSQFADAYFTDRYETEWGDPINFDGPASAAVREFFIANAAYWIEEFHLDGLRLDATQSIFDEAEGTDHIVAQIVHAARTAAGGREIYVVAENEPQDSTLVGEREAGGYGLDAMWNDDLHHSAMVALTGRSEAYYTDYRGTAQELLSAMKWGFLYQGQHYLWQQKRRGSPSLHLRHDAMVHFIQNHDQIANSLRGERVDKLTSGGRLRAMTALTLLGPATPMLFMGQEFASSAPFLYFADHEPELAEKVLEGRRDFMRQFPSLSDPRVLATMADPAAEQTFLRCKLDFGERETHAEVYALHRDLLRIRHSDHAWDDARRLGVDGAVLGDDAFVLRYFDRDGEDRLLVYNGGRELTLTPAPVPLLAPPSGCEWMVLWSSEELRYGGSGASPPESRDGRWKIAGETAFLLGPAAADEAVPAGPREG